MYILWTYEASLKCPILFFTCFVRSVIWQCLEKLLQLKK